MPKDMKILRRHHGYLYGSTNLPPQTPIIGLGCSSFSTFFIKDTNVETGSNNNETGASACASTTNNLNSILASIKTQEDADAISLQASQSKQHPLIKTWIETIHYAIKNGITLLDTAPWYGYGTSEVVIGFAMEALFSSDSNSDSNKSIQREDLIINTKVGRYDSEPKDQFDFTYDMTIKSVKRSIQRMKCTYIDVIQLHDPEFAFGGSNMDILMNETIPALLHCKDIKLVKAIGLTGYPLEVQYCILNQIEKEIARNTCSNSSNVNSCSSTHQGIGRKRITGIVFDQCLTYCHFNIHSQALFAKNIGSMDKVTFEKKKDGMSTNSENKCNENEMHMSFAQYCHSKSIPLMAAAPLSMGLLTHSQPPNWHPAPKSLLKACQNASIIANDYNVDLPTLSLLFALVHGGISCTLLGMANRKEVDVALSVVKRVGTFEMKRNDVISSDDDNCFTTLRNDIQEVLGKILTNDEKKVLSILMDETDGPFANVWSNGEYEWDGLNEVEKFWSSVYQSTSRP